MNMILGFIALGFTAYFAGWVLPGFLAMNDLLAAVTAGYVNPVAAGYSTDTILCWLVLTIWVIDDARRRGVRHGWIAVALGVVPGVVVGLALYLVLRERQLRSEPGLQPAEHPGAG